MKMFKRVLAAGAALMMAVTGMTMGASADNTSVWAGFNLHYYPNIPASENVTSQTIGDRTIHKYFYISSNGKLYVKNKYGANAFNCSILTTEGYIWDPYISTWSYTLQYSSISADTGAHQSNNSHAFIGYNAQVKEYFPYSMSSINSVTGQTMAY